MTVTSGRRAGAVFAGLGLLILLIAACAEPGRQEVAILDYRASAPADWQARAPESSMRLGEFDAGDGVDVVFFHFGPGQGGSAQANITRWEGQFTAPQGGPVSAEVTTLEGTAFPTTLAELEGSYARGIGMGGAGPPEPDQALVAAVVETPQGNLFPQMFGPREAVAARRAGFLEFVRSIGPVAGS